MSEFTVYLYRQMEERSQFVLMVSPYIVVRFGLDILLKALMG